MKNLSFLLKVLSKYKPINKVKLDIYGSIEDDAYWKSCLEIIKEISDEIQIEDKGGLTPNEVLNILSNYHYLVLPTLGENFGHVILESFQASVPVVISDKTPWNNLADKNIGYNLALEEQKWIEAFYNLERISNEDYQESRRSCHEFATSLKNNSDLKERYLNVFVTN